MDALRRHIAPFVAAFVLAALALVPLAHRWLHHDLAAPTTALTVQAADVHCDLCAMTGAPPPPTAPLVVAVFVPDDPAPVPVHNTGVARLLEAIGRAPPVV